MSRKYIKKYNIYRAGTFHMENEPKGGTVDEYDLIVSSDEELSMRRRMRELEAENEEIEQIAVISRSYINKINQLERNRAAQIPTDVSSISSTEFVTPKKRKRRKSKEHKKKYCDRQHPHGHKYQNGKHLRYDVQEIPLNTRLKKSYCKRKQKLFSKKHKKNHSKRFMYKHDKESLLLESPSSESSYLTDTDSCNIKRLSFSKREIFNNEKYITRDTLRLAVARNKNDSNSQLKKSCLRDKLLQQELVINSSNSAIIHGHALKEQVDVRDYNNDDDDDDVQVIENEPDIQIVDEDSTDSMEENELRLIALKSAVLRKHMARKLRNAEVAYSPTDFDDNKLDDIDVVDLEAEDFQAACVPISPEASPQLMMLDDQEESQQMVNCKPVDMDIANSDSEDELINNWSKVETSIPKFSVKSLDFNNSEQCGFYMQQVHDIVIPPPEENQDMDLDNADLIQNVNRIEEKEEDPSYHKQTDSGKDFIFPPMASLKDEVEDEEEVALRALLLSKFQSPKNQKKTTKHCKGNNYEDGLNKTAVAPLTNCTQKPTEIILKEAVRRLKIHTQTEISKEKPLIDLNNENKYNLSEKEDEYNENSNDSINLLHKLKNSLSKYNKSPQSVMSDEMNVDTNENIEHKETKEPSVNNNDKLNSLETISTIDIFDITRRLQKIKEKVLNLTYSPYPHKIQTSLFSETQINNPSQLFSKEIEITESKPSSSVNDEQINTNLPVNNFINIRLDNNGQNNVLIQNKTIEANIDVTENERTCKVTITNNGAIKSECNDTTNAFNNCIYKENNYNIPNTLTLKHNEGNKTNDKVALNSERLVKMSKQKTESSYENNEQIIKSNSIYKPIINDIKTTFAPAYSIIHTGKIVKPNKVINKNYELKTKEFTQANDSISVLKTSNSETNKHLSKIADDPRLITSIDQIKHKCTVAPFIITVQNSSNESSGDEGSGDYETLYKALYDYNDNASPLSLNLESPSRTPLRSNSPIEECTKRTNLEVFNLNTNNSSHTAYVNKTTQRNLVVNDEELNKTPLAVRHLPAAAQKEYRSLVYRMKLLENKRKFANTEENEKELTSSINTGSCMPVVDDSNFTVKPSLVKKVLLRNATNSTSSSVTTTLDTQSSNELSIESKLNKSNVLRSYESLYIKFGAGIVNNLDKSLKLVEEAKTAKLDKLKLENRIKDLKAEMDFLQIKHKEQQQKISRIYPIICSTNEVITSLKQKRSKVFKAALNLGKTLKGDTYRVNNDLKESINNKSKKLATEIKIINSLRAHDITNLGNAITVNSSEKKTDNEKTNIKDYNINSNEDNTDIKVNENTPANDKMCCERSKEKQEDNDLKTSLKTEVGSNTEFQSSDDENLRRCNNMDTCYKEKEEAKLNNSDFEKESEKMMSLSSYISPLEHLRNIDSNVDPNGIICPYDLMGNCEDVTCKYVHITSKN